MKMKTILLAAILVVALVPATSFAAEVAEAIMCRDVQDREPVGESDSFPADVGKVWCWSKIKDGKGTVITHAYYYGGEEKLAVSLPVGSPLWRTWSNKKILSSWTGEWRVDIVAEDGTLLKSLNFTIGEAPEPEEEPEAQPETEKTEPEAEGSAAKEE
jgi:hypothetical protein